MNAGSIFDAPPAWWCVDFEFVRKDGERTEPVCMVAIEAISGQRTQLWRDELNTLRAPPFPVDRSAIMVAYSASAELSCFRALDWPMPVYVFDCYVEFSRITCGSILSSGRGLIGALAHFNLPAITESAKDHWRERIMAGPPYTGTEREGILAYCGSDVTALVRLLPHLLREI